MLCTVLSSLTAHPKYCFAAGSDVLTVPAVRTSLCLTTIQQRVFSEYHAASRVFRCYVLDVHMPTVGRAAVVTRVEELLLCQWLSCANVCVCVRALWGHGGNGDHDRGPERDDAQTRRGHDELRRCDLQ
jgi:hypothetical protein